MPSYIDENWQLVTRAAEDIPILFWPDGRWCHAANSYMRELFERGLSRRNRGGSLAVAAAHITHLIRFCWQVQTDFIDLTDNQFISFITHLAEEVVPDRMGTRVRNANSTIAIGRNCLDFLFNIGRHYDDPGFIGPSGRIRVLETEYRIQKPNEHDFAQSRKIRKGRHCGHAAFPKPDTMRRRLPIRTEQIQQMRDAIHLISKSHQQRARRRVMLKLLEITGARRGEVAELTVNAVRSAAATDKPMLKTITLKQSGGQSVYRYIPISKSDATLLLEYVEVHRNFVIRRHWKAADHGMLLVNERTGGPLQSNTITQEVKRLAKAAEIRVVACPHMFRHRFITKLFVALIERHKIENTDQFRRLLVNAESMKRKVMEWTGHKSMASLDQYIHLAFEEAVNFAQTWDHVRATAMLESFTATLSQEADRLREGESPGAATKRLIELTETLRTEILGALDGSVNPQTTAS